MIPLFCIIVIALQPITGCVKKVQRVDPNFHPSLRNPPTYRCGDGPVVWIDEAHNNIVATKGRYEPFVEALLRDGYVVKAFRTPFSDNSLTEVEVLVIGNALHSRNVDDWSLPTPSAFTDIEIATIHRWISEGGTLLLLADHMPYAGAAADLAAVFGMTFINGFVEDPNTWDPVEFHRAEGMLVDHAITRGGGSHEAINLIATFSGAAFTTEDAEPLMVLGPQYVSYQSTVAWQIDQNTPIVPVGGWLQGAVKQVGKGRIAVFADATMFSAQLSSEDTPIGMNSPKSKENIQFLLNIMHWLTGKLDS